MDAVTTYQQQLLAQARQIYNQTPISEATALAYLATPRHLFVGRYRERANKDWFLVHDGNLQEHLATLYSDRPLILVGDDDDNVASTISQPSFVLRMLDMLQVQPGQNVFELGAGSGWNAALLGRLVGSTGAVCSAEILPDVAAIAAGNLARLGVGNVRVVATDGGDGYLPGAPYDRIICTAGAYDLPRHFYEQLREGGLLLTVIKNPGGGDNLFLMRRVGDHFESLDSMPCGFVQLTGRYRVDALDAELLEQSVEWAILQDREIGRRPFWWGGKGREWFEWQTVGIQSFLGITEPWFRAYRARPGTAAVEDHWFGLTDPGRLSLALAKSDELVSYGTMDATDRLLRTVHMWVDLGMPTAASFSLDIHPRDRDLQAGPRQWVVHRPESQFVWRLGSPA